MGSRSSTMEPEKALQTIDNEGVAEVAYRLNLARGSDGREVHIEVSEQTRMTPTPLVGDRVQATIAANGIAMAIIKLNSPPNEKASQASPATARESSADPSEADENLRSRIEERLRT